MTPGGRPPLTPLVFGRPRFAASTIVAESQSARWEIEWSTRSPTRPDGMAVVVVVMAGSLLVGTNHLVVHY